MKISPIIEVAELLKQYKMPDLVLVDASNGKNARSNYENAHLEGAIFVDLDSNLAAIKSDPADGGRHPLPDIKDFAKTLANMGISKQSHVVIYDDKNGSNAAARFWWMLKAVGHEKTQVLNGGLNEAKRNHFPLSSKAEPVKTIMEPYPVENWKLPIAQMDEVEAVSTDPDHLIIDVRDAQRYAGITEPIDLIAGHIPGATNIPFTENLDGNGLFLNPEELKTKYEQKFNHINPKNIIVHCGSGVTACHTLLAIAYAGLHIPKLYVGSWSEWSRNHKKIVTSKLI
ncbi:sulfurtransferase [Pedobacter montanisoli]|uniref:Sulfurtransferase n=1 Tax=Pedobacter montanisoli TaxID=2923277 RepID=A0ABT0A022_9SPHI|nr:sulfurtransferase [Pedobacter montanisoli]MCJ0743904.1 sulfurtransferase [Pedobacter montanisoli]